MVQPIERLFPIHGLVHREPFVDQDLGQRLANVVVVVDEEDRGARCH